MLKALAACGLLIVACHAHAAGVVGPIRTQLVDAIRPAAAKMAGQAIRIKVRVLNVDHDWALMIGDTQTPSGGEPDWTLSDDCNNGLDKTLFALAHRVDGRWQVTHLDMCEGDPPYEQPGSYDGLDLPCGLYAGVPSIYDDKPIDLCRAHQGLAPRRHR
jgi:hypothetical protein